MFLTKLIRNSILCSTQPWLHRYICVGNFLRQTHILCNYKYEHQDTGAWSVIHVMQVLIAHHSFCLTGNTRCLHMLCTKAIAVHACGWVGKYLTFTVHVILKMFVSHTVPNIKICKITRPLKFIQIFCSYCPVNDENNNYPPQELSSSQAQLIKLGIDYCLIFVQKGCLSITYC